MRRFVPWAVTTALALVVHELAGRLLAGRDPIEAFLAGRYLSTGALVLLLAGARLFLFLLAPAWALHRLATWGLLRIREPPTP